MANRTYLVVSGGGVAGHPAGDEFNASDHPELNLEALVQGGHLQDVTKQGPLKCPACQKAGKAAAKKRTYASLLELREHYGRDHPALAAPTEEE